MRTFLLSLTGLALLTPPALAQGLMVTSPLVEEYLLQPGDTANNQVVLFNSTDKPMVVALALSDYRTLPGGAEFHPSGTLPRSAASWIRLAQAEVAIPPRSQVRLDYEVRVPQEANLTGTYYAAILVQPVEGESLGSSEATVGVGITQRLGYAIQILVNVGESGQPQVSFENARVVTGDQEHVLEVEVWNRGTRYLRPKVRFELFNEQGVTVRQGERGPYTLPPEGGIRLSLALGSLPQGVYQLALVLDGGGNFVFGKRYRFTVK